MWSKAESVRGRNTLTWQFNLCLCPSCFPVPLEILSCVIPSRLHVCKSLWVCFQHEPRQSKINFEGRIDGIFEQSRMDMEGGGNKENRKIYYVSKVSDFHFQNDYTFDWTWKDWRSLVGCWICFASEDSKICLHKQEMSSTESVFFTSSLPPLLSWLFSLTWSSPTALDLPAWS